MSNVQLLNVSPKELAILIAETVKTELQNSFQNKPISDYIPVSKAIELLGITKPTLWRHVKSGKLTQYNFEGKAFYKLSEIEANMELQKR